MTTDLFNALSDQRRHVLGVVAGLTGEQLHRPVLPSGWSCLGLINHLALDVELFWFRTRMTVQPDAIADPASGSDAWRVAPDTPADQVLERYRRQNGLADAACATVSLDAAPAHWPDYFADWRLHTNRQILLHVITETACHAGHLDAARELLDTRQWL